MMNKTIQKYVKAAFDDFLEFSQETQYSTFQMSDEWLKRATERFYVVNMTTFSFSDVHMQPPASFEGLVSKMTDENHLDWFRYAVFNGQNEHMFSIYVFARDLPGNCDYAALFIEKDWVANMETGELIHDPEKYKQIADEKLPEENIDNIRENELIKEQDEFIDKCRKFFMVKMEYTSDLILTAVTFLFCIAIIKFNLFAVISGQTTGNDFTDKEISLILLACGIWLVQKILLPPLRQISLKQRMHRFILEQSILPDSDSEEEGE